MGVEEEAAPLYTEHFLFVLSFNVSPYFQLKKNVFCLIPGCISNLARKLTSPAPKNFLSIEKSPMGNPLPTFPLVNNSLGQFAYHTTLSSGTMENPVITKSIVMRSFNYIVSDDYLEILPDLFGEKMGVVAL